MTDDMRLRVGFYKTEAGKEAVRDWLKSLPIQEKKAIGQGYQNGPVWLAIGNANCVQVGERFVGGSFSLAQPNSTGDFHGRR
jgi:hypothetical protein